MRKEFEFDLWNGIPVQRESGSAVFSFRSLLFSFLVLFSFALRAQYDSTAASYGNANAVYFNDYHSTKAKDTTLDNLHNFFPRNTLGNVGLPNQPLITDIDEARLGIRYYQPPFKSDMFSTSGPVYFQAPLYTNIFASAGQKKEQVLKLNHAQLINKKVNVALRFNRYSATGFYTKQLSFVNNLLFSSHYKTTNGRYGYAAYLLYNKLKYQENGGIASDTLLKQDPFSNKLLFPVQLADARRNFKTLEISATQFIRLNKTDSSAAVNHYLYYTASYQGDYYQYLDNAPLSGYYENVYTDSLKTNDSTHLKKLVNEGRYLLRQKDERFMFFLGYRNEYTKMYRDSIWNPVFYNDIAEAGGYLQNKNKTAKLNLDAEYIVHGEYQGDYRASLDMRKSIAFKRTVFSAMLSTENRSPDQLNTWNQTNHFNWYTSFLKTQTNQAKVTVTLTDWKLKAQACIKNITNALYFDTLALPAQLKKAMTVSRFTLSKDLRIMRIHFNNEINYQVASDTTFMRIPQLVTFHQLYYEGDHYKNNLHIQVGFQLTYISAYCGNAYMPATNVFYVQNRQQTGNYPYVDFFINARIKPVKIFVKVEHINQGFSGTGYSLTPGYMQPDRAIKFGLNWLFLD